jgi:type IX secretion system substrate protein
MKKILLLIALTTLVVGVAFATPGTIHIIFDNGQIVEDGGQNYYEFDVKAWLSEGTQVLGCGMVYVEYPVDVFGNLAITNNIVTVTKTGILAGTIPDIEIELYDIFDNDTYADVYAITFDSPFSGEINLKDYFNVISNDSLAPSELLNIRMLVSTIAPGSVSYPDYIPGIDNVFYSYENETFDGGLDISAAFELVYEDTTVIVDPPEPTDPVGSVEFKSFVAAWKKNVIELKWSTKFEVDIEGYVIKRSVNGGEAVEVASYLTDPTLVANGDFVAKYSFLDGNVMATDMYTYTVEAIDIIGVAIPSISVDVVTELVETAAYPNPFNPSFVVPFEIFDTKDVDIKLYDMTGRVVRDIANGNYGAGAYSYYVDCNDLSSGVYFLRTIINDYTSTQKMLLVK